MSQQAGELVEAIHEETRADRAFIRGILVDLADSYLRNVASIGHQGLVDRLEEEVRLLFTSGLPTQYNSYITDIAASDSFSPAADTPLRPFSTEDWPGHINPREPLYATNLMKCAILELRGTMEPLGQPFDPFDEKQYQWQKRLEQALRILRLYRVGSVDSLLSLTVPKTLLRIPLQGGYIRGSGAHAGFQYPLRAEDQEPLAATFSRLAQIPPWKHDKLTSVDIAMDRYGSALAPTRYNEERLLFAIMGLEALLSRRDEGRLHVTNRLILLLEALGNEEPLEVREAIRRAYRYRNRFVHGEAIETAESSELADLLLRLLDYLRTVILVFMVLGSDKGGLLAKLGDGLFLPETKAGLRTDLLNDRLPFLSPPASNQTTREDS
jgi:NTP pyrophosphatase (non-canonical NTP hydrolase)